MFLKQLDLVGFKSFAARTSTELLPGIVVVVGPNGSGKSNIADAVLWVLGEQSAKAVRARKPEEVIFAGSASRQPLGMAEVSLILDNADASLPIEYDEVRVTRRLYRSGDSEYLLNGSKVRLKDISQLLLHAGLSPDSYSVISQGSIDELILQRPDERRVAFENVADIRRHQLRLNDTRNKLALTEANLTRVQDVLAELTPHVKRLKGQADRAARAETSRSELHDLLVRVFRARLLAAHDQRRKAEDELQEATAAAEHAEATSVVGEQDLRSLDERIAAIDERLAELRPQRDALRERARVAERSRAVVRERIAGLGEQRTNFETDLVRLDGIRDLLTRDAEEAARSAARTAAGEPEDDEEPEAAVQATLADRTEQLNRLQAERVQVQQAVDAVDRRVRDAEGRLARTEQQVQMLQASMAVDQARHSDRETRLSTLEQHLDAAQAELRDINARLDANRVRLTAAVSARNAASSALDQSREALRSISQQADRLQGALAALGADDLDRRDDADLAPDWQAALIDLPVHGRARELAERIRPIELLLGGYLQRIVVLASDDAAREAHRRLTLHLAANAPAWAVLSMTGLLLASPGERPLEVIGDEGQSVLADWSRQVRELEAQRTTAETQRSEALQAVQVARDAVDDSETTERSARIALGEAEARAVELRRLEASARNELQQLRSEQERNSRAVAQREDERQRSIARAQSVGEELAAARAERDALAETLRDADERTAAAELAVTEIRARLAVFEAAVGRREAEREARQALQHRIQAEIAANAAARESASSRLSGLRTQHAELQERDVLLSDEVTTLQQQLEPLEAELEVTIQRRVAVQSDRQSREQQLAGLRAAERVAHDTRESCHVAAQRAADEVERLNTEIAETAELEAEAGGGVAWAEQLRLQFDEGAPPREAFDLEAARRRIATLQRELRAVGSVADSVVAEYREMSERHAFLEHQSADLRVAMAELRTAAEELETHMRERFGEAFAAIQEAFQDCFVKLFGGGEARLVLTDPDDLLRTGIEIVARPPGKKLQGLVSLSGGERALTVVSLLFGLLKINPTPFCVLDEVDAALDEANVQRFANLLTEFARQIQFIVVTHNRATMDKADALYGVSMDAQGVSHVFSVKPRVLAGSPT